MTLKEKMLHSKRILKENEPAEGYYFCFSGGKDSVVCLDLLKRAKVKYETYYNITSIEHPETLEFVKTFPNVHFIPPKNTIEELIIRKGLPPTQKIRYCTSELKLKHGKDAFKVMGIRAAESKKRADRYQEVELEGKQKYILPLYQWLDKDVWEYIGKYKLRYHPLYNEGYKRVGCVLCPFSPRWQIERELREYSEIVEKYRLACCEAYKQKTLAGKEYDSYKSGDDIFLWWLRLIMRDESWSGGDVYKFW